MLERAKPSNWGTGEKLTSVQMNFIDGQLPAAIDGAGGGNYDPATNIYIGTTGLGMVNGATFSCAAGTTAYFQSTTTFAEAATFTCECVASFTNAVQIDGGMFYVAAGNLSQLSGDVTLGTSDTDGLNVNASAQFNAPVTFASTTILQGNVTLNNLLMVDGAASFSSSITCATSLYTAAINAGPGAFMADAATINCTVATRLGGPTELAGIMTPTGVGRLLDRPYDLPAGSDVTVTISDGNLFIVPALSANRAYDISTAGAVRGDVVCFSAYALTGVYIAEVPELQLRNYVGYPVAAFFYFDGFAWRKLLVATGPA